VAGSLDHGRNTNGWGPEYSLRYVRGLLCVCCHAAMVAGASVMSVNATSRAPLPLPTLATSFAVAKALLLCRHRRCRKPAHDRPKQPPRQMQALIHRSAVRLVPHF
jgi:hypothetical protein